MRQGAEKSKLFASATRFDRAGIQGEPDGVFDSSKEFMKKIAGISMAKSVNRSYWTYSDSQNLARKRKEIEQ